MPGRRGNEAQSDVEPEAHESRSRAKKEKTAHTSERPARRRYIDAGETGVEARSRERD